MSSARPHFLLVSHLRLAFRTSQQESGLFFLLFIICTFMAVASERKATIFKCCALRVARLAGIKRMAIWSIRSVQDRLALFIQATRQTGTGPSERSMLKEILCPVEHWAKLASCWDCIHFALAAHFLASTANEPFHGSVPCVQVSMKLASPAHTHNTRPAREQSTLSKVLQFSKRIIISVVSRQQARAALTQPEAEDWMLCGPTDMRYDIVNEICLRWQ